MSERPARRPVVTHLGTVQRTEWLTPHLIRVVLGGPGLASFVDNGYTDRYVKLVFPRPGVEYPEPFDVATIREVLPRDQHPVTRTYTVRWCDAATRELAIDFVYHGDEGIAAPWAAAAKPGDVLAMLGPGGAYAPAPEADWHLLVGDESALPAIASALEEVPAGKRAVAFVEVENADEQVPLTCGGELDVRWLHRTSGGDLVAAVRELDFPAGDVQAFVHGEAGFVFELRRHLLNEREVPRERLSLSGYWRRGKNEDGWQAEKADLARAEREAAAAGS
jgi:NADPH-dependent ferric siderophore reductase